MGLFSQFCGQALRFTGQAATTAKVI